ncbi:MAG TPA: amidohydrolase family protein [Acidimicrobiales bacterium]|nr:amidohydrolase family protein [Acidimicrobiales bacterium]
MGEVVAQHDLVLRNGRVIDPASGLDGVRDVGVMGGRVSAVSEAPLSGRTTVEASGKVVCPGFIDLHSHGQQIPEQRFQALDGVTTALELEAGARPVAAAYRRAAAEGRPINYGYSSSWALARMEVLAGYRPRGEANEAVTRLGDEAWRRVATPGQVDAILALIGADLAAGALGIGILVGYAPAVEPAEYVQVAALAAARGVPTYTHARELVENDPATPVDGAEEVARTAGETGARMHYCHLNSTSTRHVARVLALIERVRAAGATVTTEAYPYGTAMTAIGAAFLAPEHLHRRNLTPASITYLPTMRRLADEAELRALRRADPGGLAFITYLADDVPAEFSYVEAALAFPGAAVASDGLPFHWPGQPPEPHAWPLPPGAVGHPRSVGTFSRVLRLAREGALFGLPEAVARLTLAPARVLEASCGAAGAKGRLTVGADADLTVFDPEVVSDRATYTDPVRASTGIDQVLVGGTFVVRDGDLVPDALPGRPLHAGGPPPR